MLRCRWRKVRGSEERFVSRLQRPDATDLLRQPVGDAVGPGVAVRGARGGLVSGFHEFGPLGGIPVHVLHMDEGNESNEGKNEGMNES